MNFRLFGMAGYAPRVWPVLFALLLLFVGLFVWATTRKDRGAKSEQDRRAGLGIAALLCGPLIGALLAGLAQALGGIHPMDVAYTYVVFIIVGSIAGFMVGIAFAVTSVFSPRDARSNTKGEPTKPPGSWDEL
jgi:uncharacterized protein YqgC (DUF456 family)